MFPISRLFGRIRVFQVYSRGKKSKAGKNKQQHKYQSEHQAPSHPQTVGVPQIKAPETKLKLSNANAAEESIKVGENIPFWRRFTSEAMANTSSVFMGILALGSVIYTIHQMATVALLSYFPFCTPI